MKKDTPILHILSWINILALTPVLFVTVAQGAIYTAYMLKTAHAPFIVLYYIGSVFVLASYFGCIALLQNNRYQDRMRLLTFVSSIILALFILIHTVLIQQPIQLYGVIFSQWVSSIGAYLLVVSNVIVLYVMQRFAMQGLLKRLFKVERILLVLFSLILILILFSGWMIQR